MKTPVAELTCRDWIHVGVIRPHSTPLTCRAHAPPLPLAGARMSILHQVAAAAPCTRWVNDCIESRRCRAHAGPCHAPPHHRQRAARRECSVPRPARTRRGAQWWERRGGTVPVSVPSVVCGLKCVSIPTHSYLAMAISLGFMSVPLSLSLSMFLPNLSLTNTHTNI